MAERRMFAKTIIDSDAFIDMPVTSRLLYYDLSMRADDDGFVNSPKKIMRMIGASEDDMRILCSRKFLIPFDTGVVVIKHWRIHNYIRKDTYHETKYKEEKSMLGLDENDAYSLQVCDELVTGTLTQDRLGKDSLGKDRLGQDSLGKDKKSTKFVPPTLEEVEAFIQERGYAVNAEYWFNYYKSNGWMVGRTKMKDWEACIAQWNARDKDKRPKETQSVVSKWENA